MVAFQLGFEFLMSNMIKKDGRRRDTPNNVAELIADLGIEGARRQLRTGWATIARWMREGNIPKPQRIVVRPKMTPDVPDDWADVVPTMFKYEIADHYNMSPMMVTRLIQQTGIRSRKTAHELASEKLPKQPTPKRKTFQRVCTFTSPMRYALPILKEGAAVRAASYLRRYYPNVHRADIQILINKPLTWGDQQGLPDRGRGYHYVAGRGILTDQEVVELAEKLGFERISTD